VLRSTLRVGLGALPLTLQKKDVFFGEETITWAAWVDAWLPRADPPPRLVHGPTLFGLHVRADLAATATPSPLALPAPPLLVAPPADAPTAPHADDAPTIPQPQ
jgi:hypothetical protein